MGLVLLFLHRLGGLFRSAFFHSLHPLHYTAVLVQALSLTEVVMAVVVTVAVVAVAKVVIIVLLVHALDIVV